ncbi:MAG: 50S ribosomal protein L30 [Nanoarchaeota archaeon]|nr:50S ribosomal protein L30 [Nanoarchaeota archaeon]MBU4241659.1 50S ribosomal protein L30 [Nanoarchaeota archaeon]MBU4352457.1 50S ribosomal protein L30 [Nanoarchaeota archaeon]MBU4456251.1 50S ribosomal protein L30 [Nanoarchaeota archaeon]MCG2720255.1 50S ribosomal protein L30 [Nanoarchaeota archaeon]
MEQKRIAIVRIQGGVRIHSTVKDTLNMLRLYKKHTCVVVPNNPIFMGMLNKVKDFVTWGEINPEVFKQLLEKRGKLPAKKPITEAYLKEKTKLTFDKFTTEFFAFKKELKDVPGLKPFFKLCPPVKGYERKGTKKPFSLGGVLGYRKDKINDLIVRML